MSEVKVRKRSDWPPDEAFAVIQQAIAADKRGDEEEFKRLCRLFPMPSYLAKSVKEIYGKQYLLDMKFDLSEAEEEYGPNWLDD